MKILSLSGFIPEQIFDTVRFTGYSGDTAISHYCQYCADYISQVLNDKTIDGAVFPKSCDSTRIIKSYLGKTNKFIFQLPVPSRQDELAINYFSKEIKAYKQALEEHFKIEITDIEKRIEVLNKRNKEIKRLYENLENISYNDYLTGLHNMLTQPLYEQTVPELNAQNPSGGGKKVYLIGSFIASVGILEDIKNIGFKVVGDNFPESGRLASISSCETDGDVYKNIAESIMSMRLSPTQNNFEKIISRDIREIMEKKVRGVIFITQKYCEPYEYLYSVYEKKLRAKGIKSLKILLTNSESYKKSELALEAFADMV